MLPAPPPVKGNQHDLAVRHAVDLPASEIFVAAPGGHEVLTKTHQGTSGQVDIAAALDYPVIGDPQARVLIPRDGDCREEMLPVGHVESRVPHWPRLPEPPANRTELRFTSASGGEETRLLQGTDLNQRFGQCRDARTAGPVIQSAQPAAGASARGSRGRSNPSTAPGADRIVTLLATAKEVMVPPKKRRSPQEKKSLAYSRDRRNCYGENDKSSRKNVPRKKRRRHRAARRRQLLASALCPVDEETVALAGERVVTPALVKDFWARKFADQQLGLHVARALKRRADQDISAAQTEQARIARVLRSTTIDLATSNPMSGPDDI